MSIVDILTNLTNPDPAVRVPAEQQVNSAKESDFAGFILSVLRVFRDEGNPSPARQMALTLLKNAVAPSFREVQARKDLEMKWKSLPANVRQEVKNEVLTTLGSPNVQVRSAAANLIGSLSRIELPAGEWNDLIDILVRAAEAGEAQYQQAALTALGYICEEGADHEDVEEALKPHTNKMLTAIVRCLGQTDPSVKYSATSALSNAMEFINENMSNDQERDYLLDAICTSAKESQEEQTRECAMGILDKVATLYYNFLPSYISRIHEITNTAIFNDSEAVGLQALGFWISIAEQELMIKNEGGTSLGYCAQGLSFLVGTCLQLVVRQEEGQTEDDWNLSIAATKLIQTLAEVVGTVIHQPVMAFVYANIESQDWHQREAALSLFGCLLSVEDDDAIEALKDTVAQSATEQGLLRYLHDDDEVVADTCGWVLSVVCANFADVFLFNPQLLQRLLTSIMPMIQQEKGELFKRACDIVRNLCLAYADEENQETNQLSPYYEGMVQVFLGVIDNSVTTEHRLRAADTLNDVIAASANDTTQAVLVPLVPSLLQRLQYVQTSVQQGNASEGMESMISILSGAMADCARKLGPYFESHADAALSLLVNILEIPTGYIKGEVITAIGAISHAVSSQYVAVYLVRILNYIASCMTAYDEPDQMSEVLAATGDLCLSCGPAMEPYASNLMTVLYGVVEDPEVSRDAKINVLQVTGDMALSVLPDGKFAPYAASVLAHTKSLFQMSQAVDTQGDAETYEYVISMWHTMAEIVLQPET
ncbi:importin subunit beta-1 [Angomonas deanei]|nr:importin subunit beta-1 [Angomonas deanei]|eukprot:EPY37424.1 importin subunit beta-1 [Angomonas deanei]